MHTARTVDCYYEATGPHQVERHRAEYVFNTAYAIIARHVGRIALNPVKGVRLPLRDDQPINYDKLRIGSNEHVALFTGRRIDDSGEVAIPGALRPGIGGFEVNGDVLTTRLIVQNVLPHYDPTSIVAVSTAVHEGAHTFGLGHCATNACIMNAGMTANVAQTILTTSDPFCTPCGTFLEQGFDAARALKLEGLMPLDAL